MHKKYAEKSPMVLISGSCLDFPKERNAIMELIGELNGEPIMNQNVNAHLMVKKLWDGIFFIFIWRQNLSLN